jgi:hypothetical protein
MQALNAKRATPEELGGVESSAVAMSATLQGVDPAPARLAAPVSGGAAAAAESKIAPGFAVEPGLPLLVNLCFAGVAVLTLRLLSGWIWVQRMRSHGAVPAGDSIDRLAQSLVRRLHIGRTVAMADDHRRRLVPD